MDLLYGPCNIYFPNSFFQDGLRRVPVEEDGRDGQAFEETRRRDQARSEEARGQETLGREEAPDLAPEPV